jgi:hypothetical protein
MDHSEYREEILHGALRIRDEIAECVLTAGATQRLGDLRDGAAHLGCHGTHHALDERIDRRVGGNGVGHDVADGDHRLAATA